MIPDPFRASNPRDRQRTPVSSNEANRPSLKKKQVDGTVHESTTHAIKPPAKPSRAAANRESPVAARSRSHGTSARVVTASLNQSEALIASSPLCISELHSDPAPSSSAIPSGPQQLPTANRERRRTHGPQQVPGTLCSDAPCASNPATFSDAHLPWLWDEPTTVESFTRSIHSITMPRL